MRVLGRFSAMLMAALLTCGLFAVPAPAALADEPADEDGSALWLRYTAIERGMYKEELAGFAGAIVLQESGQVLTTAAEELQAGLASFLGEQPSIVETSEAEKGILLGTGANPEVARAVGEDTLEALGEEGYAIRTVAQGDADILVVAGGGEKGVLYGVFRLLEHIQCRRPLENMDLTSRPAIQWRVLDQWDNWDGSIERGYAGKSIYQWSELPGTVDERYTAFARANASVGINTIVINNVNTQFDYLRSENLAKVAAIADVFRDYGIRLALSVRFDSPMGLGGLSSADPLDEDVVRWWEDKIEEVYSYIPDFAGVLVKADSEGQPGPSQYGRTHADGANMFAKILEPHNGIVMWRTFVYGAAAAEISSDITLHQYGFFKPLDGRFADNVVVQNKNGPRDFLPREPVAPLIGGMEQTNVGLELQITQEYTGQSTHLCYLVPMWKEYLDFDTKTNSPYADTSQGTTVDKVIDGTVYNRPVSLIAGVANIGSDTNWTRLELAQANWYGFGRLAWDPTSDADTITKDWIALTFGQDEEVAACLKSLLDASWEIYQSYTSPYAMGMTMDSSHFSPDLSTRNRNGYIVVDEEGIGHNRNSSGSTDLTAQYFPEVQAMFDNPDTCPEELLCWFHHVPYDRIMSNGKTMIQSLYDGFYEGAQRVTEMRTAFAGLKGKIDNARWNRIDQSFAEQETESIKWRDAMAAFLYQASGIADQGDRRDAASLKSLIERYTDELAFITPERYDAQKIAAFSEALDAARTVLDTSPDQTAARSACDALDAAFETLYRSGEDGRANLAYRKPVRATVQGSASQVESTHVASDANDGLLSTRVNAVGDLYPMEWTVDLEAICTLERVRVLWYDGNSHGDKKRTYTFSVSASTDGKNYTELYSGDNSADQSVSNLEVAGQGRYLRLTVTSGTVGRPSFWEVQVYGESLTDWTELERAMEEAQALDASDYTAESWAVLEEALATAGELPETAGQTEVDAAAAAIRRAIDGLQLAALPAVDRTELEIAIKEAQALKAADYTAESWAALEKALAGADKLPQTAGQTEVDAAAAAIRAAIDDLQPAGVTVVKGDMDKNGMVDIRDIMAACRVLARKNTGSNPGTEELLYGDMTGDGKIAIDDIMAICRVIALQ